MARIRSIKPEFWDDRKLAVATTRDARLLYIGLWNFADEHARVNGDPVWIAGHIFPYETDIGADECARYLDELARGSWVVRYVVHGDPYLFLPRLAQHQRLEPDKVASRHPSPDEGTPHTPADLRECADPSAAQVFADESAPDADESALLYVAGSRLQVAGSRGAAPAQVSAELEPHDDAVGMLLTEHVGAYTDPLPPSAIVPVKREITRLVAERVPPDRIRAGLTRMRERRLGAGLLPQLVAETTPTRGRSTTDERVAQGAALIEHYERHEGQGTR